MKTKYSEARIESRKNAIVLKATKLFKKKGINDIKMTDIADDFGIGVATLYRYFRVKKTLVLACGEELWEEKYQEFLNIEKENIANKRDGISSLRALFYYFLHIYNYDSSFFLFLREFDSYILKEKISQDELSDYNAVILKIHDIFKEAAEQGFKDGTVREFDFDLLYFSFSKAILGLAQKLIAEGKLLTSDGIINGEDQIKVLLDLILSYLAKGEEQI